MQIKWLKKALKNLDQEAQYISKDSPAAAYSMAARVHEVVVLLSSYPSMGRAGRVTGTRELVISGLPYIVPYRVRGETLEILRVLHTSRKWPRFF